MNAPDASEMDQWVQVDTTNYDPTAYLTPQRMASIGHQLRLVGRNFRGASVLEVGVGAGLTAALLRQAGHEVSTLDVDANLHPTITGSVTEIPVEDGAFDAFVCCQVLEHLPWELSQQAMRELNRVTRLGGVISVPTQASFVGVRVHPLIRGPRTARLRWWFPWGRRVHSDQHEWELDAGVSIPQFRRALSSSGLVIEGEIQPVENPYHHFFLVKKAS